MVGEARETGGEAGEASQVDYAALARTVRAPLRRWWLKVGGWWLLAWLLVAIIAKTTIMSIQALGSVPHSIVSTWLTLEHYGGNVFDFAAGFALPALWLWAAAVALAVPRQLFDQVAAPRTWLARAALFRIGFNAGWPLLIAALPIAAYAALVERTRYHGPFHFGPSQVSTPVYGATESWTIQHFLNGCLGSLAGSIAAIMVLLALFILTRRMRYSLILLVCLKINTIMYALSRMGGFQDSFCKILDGGRVDYAGWFGLILVGAMLAGFATRRAWAAWSGYGLVVLGGLLEELAWGRLPISQLSLPSGLATTLNILLRAVSGAFGSQAFLMPLRDQATHMLTGVHKLTVYPLEAEVTIADGWLALAAAVAVNLLWLALLWWLIYGVIMRLPVLGKQPAAAIDQ
ncbi:hypothetical protein JW859_09415 [bacterium]|nr:hypothetical protein [bacterium]